MPYLKAHSATTAAIFNLGYLAHDEFELRIVVDKILAIAVGGGRFVHNRQKAASRKQVDREISELRTAAERLMNIIARVHGPTYEKFAEAGASLNLLDAACSDVVSRCKHQIDTADVPLKLAKAKTRSTEQLITKELADLFFRETGRQASITWDDYGRKASGDFLVLVKSVFKSLEIESSAESCIDHIRKKRGSRPSSAAES